MLGAVERARGEHRARAWQAWTTAVCGRVKDVPSLADLIGEDGDEPARRQQSPEQQLTILTAWAARNAETGVDG